MIDAFQSADLILKRPYLNNQLLLKLVHLSLMQNMQLFPELIELQTSDLFSLHDFISMILKISLEVGNCILQI